jgi:hypothetical protein
MKFSAFCASTVLMGIASARGGSRGGGGGGGGSYSSGSPSGVGSSSSLYYNYYDVRRLVVNILNVHLI